MPFISKDWRSPGDYWVKNGSGWERFKVLQYIGGGSENPQDVEQQGDQQQLQQQPHCRINLRQTREISGFNTLSEALQLLDFQNALRDQRKFQYICVIIRQLISNPLLSGNSQRILVKLLFQICDQVRIGWRYDLLRIILHEMRKSQDNCWGGTMGSSQLWNENKDHMDQLENLLATYRDEAPRMPIQDFPEEIIRLIILKLSDDKDLRSLAESDEVFRALVGENRIWKQLCFYHFNKENIVNTAIRLKERSNKESRKNNRVSRLRQRFLSSDFTSDPDESEDKENVTDDKAGEENSDTCNSNAENQAIDWETMYKFLKRNFNLKEEYAEVLNYCKPCNVLFWPSFGHPCIVGTSVLDDKDIKENYSNFLVDVKPCDFVSFFST